MIEGTVTELGVPCIELEVSGRRWTAVVDTGFNGDIELLESLRNILNARLVARVTSFLAAGQSIEEDLYLVEFPFDGETEKSSKPKRRSAPRTRCSWALTSSAATVWKSTSCRRRS